MEVSRTPIIYFAFLSLAVLTTAAAIVGTSSAGDGGIGCVGSVAGCGEHETRRGVLEGQRYITYPVLGREACNNPSGGAYTQGNGCLSNALNAYSRPCYAIYQCRS